MIGGSISNLSGLNLSFFHGRRVDIFRRRFIAFINKLLETLFSWWFVSRTVRNINGGSFWRRSKIWLNFIIFWVILSLIFFIIIFISSFTWRGCSLISWRTGTIASYLRLIFSKLCNKSFIRMNLYYQTITMLLFILTRLYASS